MAIVEKWMKPWPQDFTRNVMIIELATIWNLIRNLGAVSPYHWTSGLGHASNIRDVICDLIQFLPWETSGIWLPGLYVSSCGKLWATNQMVLFLQFCTLDLVFNVQQREPTRTEPLWPHTFFSAWVLHPLSLGVASGKASLVTSVRVPVAVRLSHPKKTHYPSSTI